jgi:hypothetical protein
MKRKRPKRLFLYLAIGCFAGLVAIFIVDGYLGIYDTFHISVGEFPRQTIAADYWLRQDSGEYISRPGITQGDEFAYCCISANWNQPIAFEYVIENHYTSSHSTEVQASVWQENVKVIDLLSQEVSIPPLDKVTTEWTLSSEDLGITEPMAGQSYDYTVRVSRGDVERRIIVSFYYYPQDNQFPKPVPTEVR